MSRSGWMAPLILILPLWPCVGQQEGVRRVVAYKTREDIRIDGVLSEAVWQAAPPIGELVQREPRPGQPASEPTEVRVAYNDNALFIAVRCRDSQPDRLRATQMQRD